MADALRPDWIAAAVLPDRTLTWQVAGAAAGGQCAEHAAGVRLAQVLPRGVPVVACGLLGQGWRDVPCKPAALERIEGAQAVPRLRQDRPAAATAGEETAIAGFLSLRPQFDGVVCVALGARSLWAQVSAGEIVSILAFVSAGLAGEVAADGPRGDAAGFAAAVEDAMTRPAALAARLAQAQDSRTLGLATAAGARAAAAGALAGAELAAARPYWLGQQVAVLGGEWGETLAAALEAQAVPVTRAGLEACLLAGLSAARAAG